MIVLIVSQTPGLAICCPSNWRSDSMLLLWIISNLPVGMLMYGKKRQWRSGSRCDKPSTPLPAFLTSDSLSDVFS